MVVDIYRKELGQFRTSGLSGSGQIQCLPPVFGRAFWTTPQHISFIPFAVSVAIPTSNRHLLAFLAAEQHILLTNSATKALYRCIIYTALSPLGEEGIWRKARMASSLYDDNAFATANSFTTNFLHSTPQRDLAGPMNLQYDQQSEPSQHGSDGTADMSIEIGRGLKRGSHDNDDVSSNVMLNFGNDHSQYELTGTPPLRARPLPRKSDGTLRKEASLRRATESARANDALKRSISGAKQRAVSDNVQRSNLDEGSRENTQPTATFQVRGSRFSRHVSSAYTGLPSRFSAERGLQTDQETSGRPAMGNATVQSATYTAQSFMLPDLPNITELVSGVRKDGTPIIKRGPVGRSRFVSASFRPQPLPDLPVTAIPVPDDEKGIYAGIQLVNEKNAQLEAANSEAQKRIEEYENEVIDLQNQIRVAGRRPDSALGSDEDFSEPAGSRADKYKLQAKVRALQEKVDRAERKISVSEITVSRISKERDALITQIGNAYYSSEELSRENEVFRESYAKLQNEHEDLVQEVEALRVENANLRNQLSDGRARRQQTAAEIPQRKSSQTKVSNGTKVCTHDMEEAPAQRSTHRPRQRSEGDIIGGKDARFPNTSGEDSLHRHRPSGHTGRNFVHDLASRIEQEVQRHRDEAAARATSRCPVCDQTDRVAGVRSRSKSRSRKAAGRDDQVGLKRHASAPAGMEVGDVESTAELDITGKTRRNSANVTKDDARDFTVLSDLDDRAVADLRRKLEAEREAARNQKQQPIYGALTGDVTARSLTRQSMPRKSSLKDLTGRIDEGTGQLSLHGETIDDIVKATKTVRVQSPHSSHDMFEPGQHSMAAGDVSIASNTSRRRRRTQSMEGLTSAFIIPDITMHGTQTLPEKLEKACIKHSAASCTVCVSDHSQSKISMPVPVTDREGYGDMTDATLRPAQEPAVALAIVIKTLEDEITHLKIQREVQNRLYNQHDPALSQRRRQLIKAQIDTLTGSIEKRSDQVYKLYDVLEGQKQAAQLKADGHNAQEMNEADLEETLQSIGVDPAELSGRVGRKAPLGFDGANDLSDGYSDEVPWEGLSDVEDSEAFGQDR